MIFVNSMSDLFHKDIDRSFVDKVFDAMEQADWHIYQVLTKRSSLMRNYVRGRYQGGPVPRHIWLGVSVEDAAHTSRIEHLKQINSDARFISFEPPLGPIGDVELQGVAWARARARGFLMQATAVSQRDPRQGPRSEGLRSGWVVTG
ncbi:protein gp37 [Amaricoccus macauensis]|uniref:Protein gp37 n=2 Tax=Amaricoccus macauensis TaxID=57001 RepID=A0A840SLZ0_9RHOB|nr:protein gp37 [Amaricoccus macauensis]